MPTVPFSSLSDDARVWIFAAERPVTGPTASTLLSEVDSFLERWNAHGAPLTCAREWRDDRFLVIGVDGSQASGCSIDGLFRMLRALGPILGTSLVDGSRVYYRDPAGFIISTTRDEFAELAGAGMVRADTHVFDTSLTSAGDLRSRFETEAERSWHRAYLRR
ncbi:MAG TPA: hypothetical protein VFS05_02975 [Gemmatimonadaceae bacterium]|nr:hypothetical protein [Gemmatimonadaceae bacterium]